jgi:hypothetical protein
LTSERGSAARIVRGDAVVSEGLGRLFSSGRFLEYRRAALELCRAIAYE